MRALLCLLLFFLAACPKDQHESMAQASPTAQTALPDVTIGYLSTVINPWKIGIQNGTLEKISGKNIAWQGYTSSAEIIKDLEEGKLQISIAGSTAIATSMSQGLDLDLFWVMETTHDSDALVARNDSGIKDVKSLRGKTVGVPFVSTSHYLLLAALKNAGMANNEVNITNLQPESIRSSWEQQGIDAAFVWNPTLEDLKKSGRVLITAGDLEKNGALVYDGMLVQRAFSQKEPLFMRQLIQMIVSNNQDYLTHGQNWTVDSPQIQAVSTLLKLKPDYVLRSMGQYQLLNYTEQLSAKWLKGKLSHVIRDTAVFLKQQDKVMLVLDDYSPWINPSFAEAAQAAQQTTANTSPQ